MRSHPEQTTSPPLMVRALRAPTRAAERQAGALPTRPTPAGGAAAGTSLSRGGPQSDGVGGVGWLPGAPELLVRASPPKVRGQEQKRAAPPRPTPRGRGRRRRGQPGLLSVRPPRRQAPRPASPQKGSGSAGLCPGTEPGPLSPCAPPPRDGTSPERFPRQTLPCTRTYKHARTHSLTHTITSAAPTPALPLSVSVRPGLSYSSPSPGEGGSLPRTPGKQGGKGKPREPRGQRAQGRSRVGGETRGVAGRRVPGRELVPPKGRFALAAAKEGGERRRNQALGCSAPGMDPTVPRRLPHPGRAAGSEPPGPRPRSLPLPASGLPLPPFPPPLPTFGLAPVSAQTFSETPPERFQPKQQGQGRR